MKHYLMAFFILFSALSSQWVGAMTFQYPHQHSTESVKTESVAMQHDMLGHDSCPSMQKEDKQALASDCSSCLDDCQCDSGFCHSNSSSPLASLSSNRFHSPALAVISVSFISAAFPIAPVSQEKRPPKFA